MQTSAPRRTVYRISLTLVKRESSDDSPKNGAAFRREHSVDVSRAGVLDRLREYSDDDEGLESEQKRDFRTFSTGQLEMKRRKFARVQRLETDAGMFSLERKSGKNVEAKPDSEGNRILKDDKNSQESKDGNRLESFKVRDKFEQKKTNENCQEFAKEVVKTAAETGAEFCPDEIAESVCKSATTSEESEAKTASENSKSDFMTAKKLLKAKSVDDRSLDQNRIFSKTSPESDSPSSSSKLRRSFSFRHWNAGEMLRFRALSKAKHHGSSGNIPQKEKSRTLEVGAVLLSKSEVVDLKRKTRTLDNSDLQNVPGGFIRGGDSRGSESGCSGSSAAFLGKEQRVRREVRV
ncbi:hypothetical protein WMY93_032553 [Mugilogobius chulae]|uniref:Uncharacterized protein n=1 Tax=Mugilogobius chulae TaxID=88201 RepID=A0AAW0MNN7_9GOBI